MIKGLISIIVPAYNIEEYIGRCLDSLMNQTHENIEVNMVNDGSMDNTGRILDKYAEEYDNIKVIHKENGGVSIARMTGIRAASGEYIGFVDGDDVVAPNMFEKLYLNMKEYNADISHCGYQMIFPNGKIDYYYNTRRIVIQDHDKGIEDLLKGDYIEPGLCNKLYHYSLIDNFLNSKIWDNSIKINEDLLMNYILFSFSNRAVYEDLPLYHYILRKGSATKSSIDRKHIVDPIKVREIILNQCDNDVLLTIVLESYIRVLIRAQMQNDLKEESKIAKSKLKKIIHRKDFGIVSTKMRVMAILVAYFKVVYVLIRKIYNIITKIDKKYDID